MFQKINLKTTGGEQPGTAEMRLDIAAQIKQTASILAAQVIPIQPALAGQIAIGNRDSADNIIGERVALPLLSIGCRDRFMLTQRGLDQRQRIGAGRRDGVKPARCNLEAAVAVRSPTDQPQRLAGNAEPCRLSIACPIGLAPLLAAAPTPS